MILPNFPRNCMTMRKFWAMGGVRWGASLGSATAIRPNCVLLEKKQSITPSLGRNCGSHTGVLIALKELDGIHGEYRLVFTYDLSDPGPMEGFWSQN